MAQLGPIRAKLPAGEEITLRSVVEADSDAVLEYLLAQHANTDQVATQPDEFPSRDEERHILRGAAENPNWLYLLTLTGTQIISVCSVKSHPRRRLMHTAELGITVHAGWRGRGVGRAAIHAQIDWARRHPLIEIVHLSVFHSNAAGLALYRSLGFVEDGRRIAAARLAPDRYVDELLMSLRVKPLG